MVVTCVKCGAVMTGSNRFEAIEQLATHLRYCVAPRAVMVRAVARRPSPVWTLTEADRTLLRALRITAD
jgi:hypothetical protein